MKRAAAILSVVILLAGLAGKGGAASPKVVQRQMSLGWKNNSPSLTASFAEVFDQTLKKRISSGFASRIVVEVFLQDRQRKLPLAQGLFQMTVLYDIWEEHFAVSLLGPEGERRLLVNDMDSLVRTCSTLQELRLNPLMDIADRVEVEAEMRVTVNPAVPGLHQKVRQYLANPDGGRHLGSPRSFFGSFSRIFVSEGDVQADSIYIFRSQPMMLQRNKTSALFPPAPPCEIECGFGPLGKGAISGGALACTDL